MIIVSGKVFNLDGKTVPVRDENRFVLNFTVSEYLGKNRNDEALYRSHSVSVWDKRGEALHKFLKEKSVVTIATSHYKAEAYKSEKGKDGMDAKIKLEIWSDDKVDVLFTPGDGNGGGYETGAAESDFSEDEDPFKD